jgi:hypothetical protein
MIPILILLVLVLILAKLCYKPRDKFTRRRLPPRGIQPPGAGLLRVIGGHRISLLWILSAALIASAIFFFRHAKLRSKEVERDLFIASLN